MEHFSGPPIMECVEGTKSKNFQRVAEKHDRGLVHHSIQNPRVLLCIPMVGGGKKKIKEWKRAFYKNEEFIKAPH